MYLIISLEQISRSTPNVLMSLSETKNSFREILVLNQDGEYTVLCKDESLDYALTNYLCL